MKMFPHLLDMPLNRSGEPDAQPRLPGLDVNGGPDREESVSDHTKRLAHEPANAFKIYLREIGSVKLLSPAEEVQLARRVQAGDEDARQQMIKANLRLVVKIARGYEGYGVPLLDLISEGNIGLMKAVERYDPAKGGRLSTYAACWIKQGIRSALVNQSKAIRLPAHVALKLHKVRKTTAEFLNDLGREPTTEELAARLAMTTKQIRKLQTATIPTASIDAPLKNGSEPERFGDIIEDESAGTPYEFLVKKTDLGTLRRLLKKLPEREATVLRLRFGLGNGEPMTLEAIGEEFDLTRERIRQLETSALKRLREVWPNSHAAKAA